MVTVGMYPCSSVTRSFMLAEGASAVGVSGCLWVTLCHADHCFCCIILCNNELKDQIYSETARHLIQNVR